MTRHGPTGIHLATPISRETILLVAGVARASLKLSNEGSTGPQTYERGSSQIRNRPKNRAPGAVEPALNCTRI